MVVFMYKYKKILVTFILLLFPFNVFGYSDYIIPGGENIGIEIQSEGIIVIGFYKVDGKINKGNPELKVGDRILKVNNNEVANINEMIKAIDKNISDDKVNLTVLRDSKYKNISITLNNIDGVYKTGLYVKDSLTGIGTLSYIDPETHIYGALGHEILETSTLERIEVKTGTIFESTITRIEKSTAGHPGGKLAKFNYKNKYGIITNNTNVGIYGIYEQELPDKKLLAVANINEIELEKAELHTVIKGDTIEKFDINIIKIDEDSEIKNIIFEITDQKLLDKTGGIVQGMSGSPIIQNNKIIGAVTHVFVDDTTKGYGIFITSMLSEGDKSVYKSG